MITKGSNSRFELKGKQLLPIRVAMISKQTRWLFWNSFTNGNASTGRYWVSPNIGDQLARADRILKNSFHVHFVSQVIHNI